MRILALFTMVFISAQPACGARVPEDRSPGPLGFASDRAHETRVRVDVTARLPRRAGCAGLDLACVEGAALERETDRRVAAMAAFQDALGAPLFLSRADRRSRVTSITSSGDTTLEVKLVVDLVSFARDAEHPRTSWPFPPTEDVAFSDPARTILNERLPSLAAADGVVRVTLVFGQLGKEALRGDDPGLWSAREAARLLASRGYVGDGTVLRRGKVVVRIVDPWHAPLHSRSAAREITAALHTSDVVYVNGHARSGLFDGDEAPGKEAVVPRAKLVFADTCWSYSLEATKLAARWPLASLIVTDGRVTTGSVGAVATLLDAVERRPTWRALLRDLNDAAESRAAQRRDEWDLRFRSAEVYGVIPPRSAGAVRPSLPPLASEIVRTAAE